MMFVYAETGAAKKSAGKIASVTGVNAVAVRAGTARTGWKAGKKAKRTPVARTK